MLQRHHTLRFLGPGRRCGNAYVIIQTHMYMWCAALVTLLLRTRSVGRLRVALLQSRALCVDRAVVTVETAFVDPLVFRSA